jgi:hypothetical protein
MPLDYEQFPAYRLRERLLTALEGIDPANGYATRPQVSRTLIPPDATSERPLICLDTVLIAGLEQLFGSDGNETLTEDAEFGFIVWGYYEDEVDKERAMWALLVDILSAVYSDETFDDTVIGVDFIQAAWDVARMDNDNEGALRAEFRARVQFARGG